MHEKPHTISHNGWSILGVWHPWDSWDQSSVDNGGTTSCSSKRAGNFSEDDKLARGGSQTVTLPQATVQLRGIPVRFEKPFVH